MSVNINADTTNGLVMTSDTSGELKLQSAGADIATVNSSGITMASGKTLPASALTGALPAIDGSALTNLSSYTDSDALTLFNASGSAPVYACRAWVKFKGTGAVTINGSGNVSSVTDNGTGQFTANFSTAMPDTNYSVATVTSTDGSTDRGATSLIDDRTYTTSAIRILVWYGSGLGDQVNNCIQIFR